MLKPLSDHTKRSNGRNTSGFGFTPKLQSKDYSMNSFDCECSEKHYFAHEVERAHEIWANLAHPGRSLALATLGALGLAYTSALWEPLVAGCGGVHISTAMLSKAANQELVAAARMERPDVRSSGSGSHR